MLTIVHYVPIHDKEKRLAPMATQHALLALLGNNWAPKTRFICTVITVYFQLHLCCCACPDSVQSHRLDTQRRHRLHEI